MPELIDATPSSWEATYKVREFEGVLDLYFYRRVGYWMARFFAWLKMTPSGVTLVGGVFGILAGHLYYYSSLRLNLIGMALHVLANALDNADGQLARLTNTQSRRGRIIDSVVDHIIFINIYVHLGLRCLNEGASPAIALLVLAAGLSHALQASAADYARNAFLYIVKGRGRAHYESYDELLGDYQQLRWSDKPLEKLLLGIYLRGTRQQELLFPGMFQLQKTVTRDFVPEIPAWWQARYRAAVGPTFRHWGLLMTNTRMLLLFAVLLINHVSWFFWIEVTVFNLLFLVLILQQTRISKTFLGLAAAGPETA
jgi:hypothetical protein